MGTGEKCADISEDGSLIHIYYRLGRLTQTTEKKDRKESKMVQKNSTCENVKAVKTYIRDSLEGRERLQAQIS